MSDRSYQIAKEIFSRYQDEPAELIAACGSIATTIISLLASDRNDANEGMGAFQSDLTINLTKAMQERNYE